MYLMRDGEGTALYVGKAKNLRKRLTAYRVANPSRMKRRHLRLLRETAAIEFELCEDEASALAREADLLLDLRPRFNRVGTWPAPRRHVVWRVEGGNVTLAVSEEVGVGWQWIGPMGSGRALSLRAALVRLLWLAACPERGLAGMPWGWAHGRLPEEVTLGLDGIAGAESALEALFCGDGGPLHVLLCERLTGIASPSEAAVMAEDLERLDRVTPPVMAGAEGD